MPMRKFVQATSFVLFATLSGCATVGNDARDPWEGWNRNVQDFNDGLDKYAIKPVAKGYQWITPSYVDQGVTNFFSNIDDISVTINDLLQFKIEQTGSDGARFLVNSVAGVGGLIDVASLIDLPKHREDFDQTLGVWGVPTGPYLVLPLFGPSSPRGVGGLIGKAVMNPITYIDSAAITGGLFTLNTIDIRSDNLSTEKIAEEASLDRYEFFKNSYFQNREYLVKDGNVPDSDDIDLDEGDDAPINPFSR
ncbi:MAG: VacJ family lipoprotein [Methylococcaceae bacterium]